MIEPTFISKILKVKDADKFLITAPSASPSERSTKECEAIAINGGDSRGFYEGDTVLAVEVADTRRPMGKWSDPRTFVIIGRIDG